MRVFGTIEDARSGKLLEGAVITLRVGDTELIQNTPSRDGRFACNIPDASIPIDVDVLTCLVRKKGYKPQTSTYTITENDIEVAVELVPDPVNWKRIFTTAGIILGSLLLLAIIIYVLKVFVFPPKEYRIAAFTITPASIDRGGEAEIKWETQDADIVLLGKEEVEELGSKIVNPTQTTKYQLILKDDDGKAVVSKTIVLEVIPPPPVITGFTATPLEINLWESSTLEWKTTGAETLYIYSDPNDGSFNLDAKMIEDNTAGSGEGDGSNVEKNTGNNVGNNAGNNAEKNDKKNKDLNGSIKVSPLQDTKYTLVVVNSHEVKRESTITVRVLAAPDIIKFTATDTVIDAGQSVILDWNTDGAQQVFLNGERVRPRFSREVRPADTTTYRLVARNQAGDRTSELNVMVRCDDDISPTVDPDPPSIHRFHISSPVIAPGESSVLSWVTDHAEKVYLTAKTQGTGTTPPAPAAQVQPSQSGNPTPTRVIAGKPLTGGLTKRVNPIDSMEVSPRETTFYQLRAVNLLKEVLWTRTVEVNPQACTVILYELENYKGRSVRFTGNAAEIGKMNNNVSSVRIIGNCAVKVFSAPRFQATHQEFTRSVPRLRGTWIGNNTISSIKLIQQPGVKQ